MEVELVSLCKLLDFYFSDNNLCKDSFLRGKIEESEEGWVMLDLLMTFNKVKKITTEKEILRKAVTLSKLLILSEDGENIKRVIPYQPVVIGPEYCVYVEGLSPEWDHDKVAGIFSRYGEIAHISLPKSKHSDNYRGFAFIEYKEKEFATKALELHNYREPTWVNCLTVLSKKEWMQRKQEFKVKAKQNSNTTGNPVISSSSSSSDIPFLQASNLQGSESPRELWRLFSMIGPIHHLEVYQKTNSTEFVNEHSCIVQYESQICTERCKYFFSHFPQLMTDKPLTVREMTKDEASRYQSMRKLCVNPDQSADIQKETVAKDEGRMESKQRKRKKKDVDNVNDEGKSPQTTDNSKRPRTKLS